MDNLPLSPVDNQLQVDLQRKQAELQASIGHQQQELRRISEQLLMARLGLLQQQTVSIKCSQNGGQCVHWFAGAELSPIQHFLGYGEQHHSAGAYFTGQYALCRCFGNRSHYGYYALTLY